MAFKDSATFGKTNFVLLKVRPRLSLVALEFVNAAQCGLPRLLLVIFE